MQPFQALSLLASITVVLAAPAVDSLEARATIKKANEYQSGDWYALPPKLATRTKVWP